VEGKYYADGEDAFDMRRRLDPKARPSSQQADQEKERQQSQVWPALSSCSRQHTARHTASHGTPATCSCGEAAAQCAHLTVRVKPSAGPHLQSTSGGGLGALQRRLAEKKAAKEPAEVRSAAMGASCHSREPLSTSHVTQMRISTCSSCSC
jgi:hypothetical protein